MRHHPVFYKKPKPDDKFYYSIGKSSTTTHWNPPTYDLIYKLVNQIKNNTNIFEKYNVFMHGKILFSYNTKDLDLILFKKESVKYTSEVQWNSIEDLYKNFTSISKHKLQSINLYELENDFKTINDIGFDNRIFIDPSFRNNKPNANYILSYEDLKSILKISVPKINNSQIFNYMYSPQNDTLWNKHLKEIFYLKPKPIIKKINEEVGTLQFNSALYTITPYLHMWNVPNFLVRFIGGSKFLERMKNNPTHSFVDKFDCEEFLAISEEEFKCKTNHNKNLIL
jgi:hypothetical protein